MTQSMTGYALYPFQFRDQSYQIELKSLNNKGLDINFRLPHTMRSVENRLKNLLAQQCTRGKIDVFVQHTKSEDGISTTDAKAIAEKYAELATLADRLGAPKDQLFTYVLSNCTDHRAETLTEQEMEDLEVEFSLAVKAFTAYRIHEGATIERDILGWIETIAERKEQVATIDPTRSERKREKLTQKLDEFFEDKNWDRNRLEQEMIFYLEKLDISEELSRLEHHLLLFVKTCKEEAQAGKKLGFIAQEIGREINTIGSKANDYEIQKYVIEMKDNLEKIKEQINNIL